MFHLIPTGQGSFYVQNDIFRLNYAWRVPSWIVSWSCFLDWFGKVSIIARYCFHFSDETCFPVMVWWIDWWCWQQFEFNGIELGPSLLPDVIFLQVSLFDGFWRMKVVTFWLWVLSGVWSGSGKKKIVKKCFFFHEP